MDHTHSQLKRHDPRAGRWALLEGRWSIGVVILIAVAFGIVQSTWRSMSATYDEPFHIGCGMGWLGKGRQVYDTEHPPLAQQVVAFGPHFIRGIRSFNLGDATDEGNYVLYATGSYWGSLSSARSGNLVFLALAGLFVYLWCRRWFSSAAGFWAVLLLVTLPPILGHSGLATLDMASSASVAVALYAFMRCLESPTGMRLALLGISLAFAFLCKFSGVPFLGACMLCAIIYFLVQKGAGLLISAAPRLFARTLVVSGVVFVVMWGGYRFSLQPISDHVGDHPAIDSALGNKPLLRTIVHKVIETPLPLVRMGFSVFSVASHNSRGHESYLLGENRFNGWWYFFPVVIGVKTPIPFLILAAIGLFSILRRFRSTTWEQHLTAIFPCAILLVCMASKIDLGVRHILAIYPLLAIAGGYAITLLFGLIKAESWRIAVFPMLLVGWTIAECWAAHPDYLAYFNEFAGAHPEKILVESDLDWGQDLYRLNQRLKERQVDHLSLLYFGTAPLEKAGLPPYTILSATSPVRRGYVAVSLRYLTLGNARDGSFGWLCSLTPLERIGKSINLYYLGP